MLKHVSNFYAMFKPLLFLCLLMFGTTYTYASSKATGAGNSNIHTLFIDSLHDSCHVDTYNGRTVFHIKKDSERKNNVLQLDFDDKTYTTVEIALKPENTINFSRNKVNAYIKFKVKGKFGGEQCFIGVADDNRKLKARIEVKYYSSNYFDITDTWQEVTCPLNGFTNEGEWWFETQKVNEYSRIDWSRISSVRFSTEKEMNYGRSTDRISTIFIDDLEFVVDSAMKPLLRRFTPWRYDPDSVCGPEITVYDSSNIFFSWLDSRLAPRTSVYTYGYPTDYSIFDPVDKNHAAVFATFQNDKEWSGVTLYRNNIGAMDVSPWYQTGGIEFYIKGNYGGELFYIGLLDDESDGIDKKVQSRISSRTVVKVTRDWQRVFIPFSSFESIGRWWNSDSHYEVVGTLDWSKISEIRISVDLYANKPILKKPDEPVVLYFSNIRFIKKSNVVSNELFWESFSSSEPDRLIEDFNKFDMKNITMNIDSTSSMSLSMVENTEDHSNAVNMQYRIGLWGSAACIFPGTDSQQCNWSSHNAVSFDFYSSEKSQTGMLMIVDSGSEAWTAHFIAKQGWQKVTVPFARFRQFEWWQPDNAHLDGKMDLCHVRTFDWRPGINGKKGNITIDNLKVTNYSLDIADTMKNIQINQVGYLPGFFKKFSVTDRNAYTFIIKNSDDHVILTNSLSKGIFCEPSGQYVKTGEFSGISQPGVYTLTIQETGESVQITIKDTLNSVLRDVMRAFYYQRASIDLPEQYAGKFHHNKGHPDTAAVFHPTTNRSGTADVRGGWYDAGDYGKYIINAGISCFRLLSLYELYPRLFGDSLNIPESGNKVNDLLDEVRYEIEWFKRMQDIDGGVFFKVGALQWDGFVMPDKSTLPRYIIGKSTASTLNFSACLAMAGRIFRDIDKQFSRDCIKRAIAAWDWAIQNPSVDQPPEAGGTGAYSDHYFEDEFFWAASELFTTTKKPVYKKYIERTKNVPVPITSSDWQNVGLCGYLTLVTHFTENDVDAVTNGNIIIRNVADSIVSAVDTTPFGVPSPQFSWGSNGYMLNYAAVCCYAYKQTGKRKYLNAVIDIVNYIFGNNATGYSFVTGYGFRSPLQPHHRIMGSDDIDEPYPGFLAGGPNSSRQDEVSKEPGVYYPYKEPARSYVDAVAAYASNEICINWNAVLVFVLGFLQMNK
jgi:endoglucanase